MPACCCGLAGTNACRTCSNGPLFYQWDVLPYHRTAWQTPRTPGRVIEKFDTEGKLIERITEG